MEIDKNPSRKGVPDAAKSHKSVDAFLPRRHLIFRQVVMENRPLKFEEMTEFTGRTYTPKMAKDDCESFAKIGCMIKISGSAKKRDHKLYYAEAAYTDYEASRENLNTLPKELVAGLAASLICGYEDPTDQVPLIPSWLGNGKVPMLIQRLETARYGDYPSTENELRAKVESILTSLHKIVKRYDATQNVKMFDAKTVTNRAKAGRVSVSTDGDATDAKISADILLAELSRADRAHDATLAKVAASLRGFWQEAHRMVAIDSGTTNIALARCLKQIQMPVPGSALCSLTICTNSRRIFEELGPADVPVKTIIVGGQQKHRSPTIAGAMAELFLRTATLLQFGICFVGATKVDVERLTLCSDSQEEASIKTLLLERSSLRIVCVDDSKLQVGPGREGYKFSSIDPRNIDLIITNSPLITRANKSEASFREAGARFRRRVAAIRAQGVPVLVASRKNVTLPWPENGDQWSPE